jgi:preprotein translocase subunit SecG
MLTALLLVVHITVCLILILVVLLQTGKRADLAGAFGGGGSQTAFGARGAATFLSKATTWSAIIFMVTSVVLGVRFGSETSESVVPSGSAPAPAAPAAPAAIPVTPQPVPVQPPAGAPANPAPAQPTPAKPPAGQPPAAPSGK